MTDRRYSIIPARAVVDPRLEGRDLQVLGYLGTFTDKLGWCFVRQGKIADAIGCGRSTVQRSIARLIEAGWVQTREFNGNRPHACHAYRVVMDLDDPQLEPPEYEAGDDDGDERCPQVGTSVPEVLHPRAPVPTHERAPPAPEVPTYTRAHNDQDSSSCSDRDPRARATRCAISPEAFGLADEIARIAGHDPAFLPPRWVSIGPAMRLQTALDLGWRAEMMLDMARAMMRQKKGGPPSTIAYFEPGFAEAHARQSVPAALPTFTTETAKAEHAHAPKTQNSNDWRSRRDRGHDALRQFREAIDSAEVDRRREAG